MAEVAGKKVKKMKRVLEPVSEAAENGHSKFARALASTDYMTREKGLQALTAWLQRKADLTSTDMLKLWKGIYFCFWHSDKAPVQAELAERLAAVLPSLTHEVGFQYFACFILTMQREWFSIDKHRLDKFLMLIRRFMTQIFVTLKTNAWQQSLVEQYTTFLRDKVFLPSGEHCPLGLTFHIYDVFLPELKKAVDGGKPVPKQALAQLLEPFSVVLLKAPEQAIILRAREAFYDEVVAEIQSPSEGSPLQNLDVQGLANQLFDLGAQPEVRARNRTALYETSKQLEKTSKKKQKCQEQTEEAPAPAPAASTPAPVPQGQTRSAPASTSNGPVSSSSAPPSTGKKKRKAAELAAAAAAVVNGTLAKDGVLAQPSTSSGKGHKNSAAKDAASPAASPGPPIAIAATAAAVAPATTSPRSKAAGASGKKSSGPKLLSTGLGASAEDEPASNKAAVQSASPATSASTSAAGKTPLASAMKKQKQQQLPQQEAAANGDNTVDAPDTAPRTKQKPAQPEQAGAVPPTTGKKSVRINLKKNLYFEFNGPVPLPDVRTPPASRSKGGILKAISSLPKSKGSGVRRLSASSKAATPKSAPAKMQQRQQQQQQQQRGQQAPGSAGRVTPKSVQRAKAALFF